MTIEHNTKRVRRSQAERSADTRRKVVDAAVRCLARGGYAATTTTTVALEAGVTRGAMFHQYPTKVDLMLDVVRLISEEETHQYEEMLNRIEDTRERFFMLAEVMWELGKRPTGIAMIEIMNGSRNDSELAGRLGPIMREVNENGLSDIQTALTAAGLGNMAPDLPLARLVLAAIRGLVIERVFSSEPEELDQSVIRLREIMQAYYGATDPTPSTA